VGARSVASGPPVIISEHDVVLAGETLVFDWRRLGYDFTALAFMVSNLSSGDVVVTPEMSPDGVHAVTVGVGVPAALTVPAGGTSYDPYGIDLLARFWRLWLSGNGNAYVHVLGLKRGAW
jgi:hypothetical protein